MFDDETSILTVRCCTAVLASTVVPAKHELRALSVHGLVGFLSSCILVVNVNVTGNAPNDPPFVRDLFGVDVDLVGVVEDSLFETR